MNNKLSHSSASKYGQCPEMYRLHYQEKLRGHFQSAALVFGSAVDNMLTEYLKDGDTARSLASFMKSWSQADINKVIVNVADSDQIVYADADADIELLTSEDIKKLNDRKTLWFPNNTEDAIQMFELLKDKKKEIGFGNLAITEKKYYNYVCWHSLARKAPLFLEAVERDVMPHIKKVISTQEYWSISNEDGDKITGVTDLVAELKDGTIAILDWKTSASEYDKDSAKTSPQLAIYAYALYEKYRTNKVGFLVLKKAIDKNRIKTCTKCGYIADKGSRHKTCSQETDGSRCGGAWNEVISPKARTQVIFDTISKRVEEIVLDNFMEINYNIKMKKFHRNLNLCHNFYGQKCVYYKKCWEDDDSDLVKVE